VTLRQYGYGLPTTCAKCNGTGEVEAPVVDTLCDVIKTLVEGLDGCGDCPGTAKDCAECETWKALNLAKEGISPRP
jgi:hypothetical protein